MSEKFSAVEIAVFEFIDKHSVFVVNDPAVRKDLIVMLESLLQQQRQACGNAVVNSLAPACVEATKDEDIEYLYNIILGARIER